MTRPLGWLATLAVVGALACAAPGPRPLALGRDVCAHCHMTVADARFGGELVLTTGKIYAFDDAGCLAAFLEAGSVPPERIGSLWVVDFLAPGSLLPAGEAVYLESSAVPTPMRYDVVATRPGPAADSLARALGATRLDFPALRALARDPAGL